MSRLHSSLRALLALTFFAAAGSLLHPQSDNETDKLTSDQRLAYQKAGRDFASRDWATAFSEFKALHEQIPANINFAEFLGEAALNLNKQSFAIEVLQPIAQSSSGSWQAVALLARAYAETMQDAKRDFQIAAVQALHDGGHYPELSRMQQFRLERHVTPDGGEIAIWYSLKPWGPFKAYLYARYTDAAGKEQSYMTLESSDTDQTLWAKQHPKEAAAGERVFSLDAYTVTKPNGDGTLSRTHATMGFYDGKPSYNLIRDRMLASLREQAQSKEPSSVPAGAAQPTPKP